jgi:hypothetical protein
MYFFKKKIPHFSSLDFFYILTTFFFIIFYLFARLYSTQYDTLQIYFLSLKPLIGQQIYQDYSFTYSPYIDFFFQIFSKINIDSFNFLLILGIIQSLFAGFLSILFCKEIFNFESVKKICFFITVFTIGVEYFYLFWDCFVPLLGIYGLYLVFLKKKFIFGTLILSFIWFLKQTFGITFFLIFIFLSLVNFFYYKKKIFLINIFIFFSFSFAHVLIIYIFSDFQKFYNENLLIIFKYADIYKRNSILDYLFGVIFLFPDINNFETLKNSIFVNFSFSQLIFYFLFRLPVFLLYVYLLFYIRDFFKGYYQALVILLLSSILPLPLLGRGYWGTIYFFPILSIFFIICFFNKIKIYSSFFKNKIFFLLYSYIFILFIYTLTFVLKKSNFNLRNDVIKSNFLFLNFSAADIRKSEFDSVNDMYQYMRDNKIENIFIMNNTCVQILALLSQVSVNRDFMGISLEDKYFDWNSKFWSKNETNLERFVNDFNTKSAKYVLYNSHDYLLMKKDLPENLLNNYLVKYSNNNFVLLEKLNNN